MCISIYMYIYSLSGWCNLLKKEATGLIEKRKSFACDLKKLVSRLADFFWIMCKERAGSVGFDLLVFFLYRLTEIWLLYYLIKMLHILENKIKIEINYFTAYI